MLWAAQESYHQIVGPLQHQYHCCHSPKHHPFCCFTFMKTHKKFNCEQCEKSFRYLDIKKKHVLIQHENVKLYCHYYNNQKTCPFDDESIFLHEDARYCKYDLICERNYCMFKHRKHVEPDVENDEIDNEKIDLMDEEIEEEADKDILDISVNDKMDDSVNTTFMNP